MASQIDVSILIVSYNTRELTREALDSVYAETRHVSFEVIVVDNASVDGSADMIAQHPGRPKFIRLTDNIGFARANNLAAQSATGRRILLLNPDTVVLEHAIDRLSAFADANPKARLWGGRTLFGDGRLNASSCWGRMSLWNLFCRASGLAAIAPNSRVFNTEALGGWNRDSVRAVDIVSGCFLLIDRDMWSALGGFDSHFFMYGEDADLCLRAQQLGARPMITPDATIVHYGGASERVRSDKMVRLLRAKASLINRHWHPVLAPWGRALLAAWPLTRLLATSLKSTASTSAQNSAATWRAVWQHRTTWFWGYPEFISQPVVSPAIRAAEART